MGKWKYKMQIRMEIEYQLSQIKAAGPGDGN